MSKYVKLIERIFLMFLSFAFTYEPDTDDHLEEDEELARALQESLKDTHPLRQKIPAGGVHSDSTPATSLLPDILPSSRSRYLL